jgi:hypothetical protein
MKKIELNKEELDNILKMYNDELLGTHTISLKIGINKQTINRILKENGVVFGPSGRRFIGGKKISDKKYRQKNKEYLNKYHKKWSEDKQEHLREYHQQWRDKNIDKHREYKRNYEKTRKHNDPTYKLIANFRTAIWTVLKENNMDKYGHYFDILRYSPDELVVHLENQFTEGMTWDNYGEWHVDHRLPITSFKFQEVGDNEFMRCWELNNLQPMWGDENISKSNKVLESIYNND